MLPQSNYQLALQRYMHDLLHDRYYSHTNIITRVGHYLVTEKDLTEFSALLGDVYETAYTKALSDYQEKLEAAGIKVAIAYNGRSNE